MSRKHYREAAEVLHRAYRSATTLGQEETVGEIANGLASMFRRDNLNFDRQRFMDAVYGERA